MFFQFTGDINRRRNRNRSLAHHYLPLIFVWVVIAVSWSAARAHPTGEVLGIVVIPTSTPTPTPTPTHTPIPTPTNSPTPMPASAYEEYFDEYSKKYGVDKDVIKKIAYCESGGNPGATNGEYGGMFQYAVSTWEATRREMGADPNPDLRFGARESIETTAFKLSRAGNGAWKNCLRTRV